MELRHLRYFVAVAEEGSVTNAAQKRLNTSQPSLSRQLHDLEGEVGADLFERGSRGVALTPAGRAFLDHARACLHEAALAVDAARRIARPSKPTFSIGFLTGQEVDWLPHVMHALRAELAGVDLRVSSRYSPDLADDLAEGLLDVAFLRVEARAKVSYRVIAQEPLVAVVPSDHPLASKANISPKDFEGEEFIGFSDVPHVLRDIVARYLAAADVTVVPKHAVDNYAMGLSLVASIRGVMLLPAYVEPLLPWSVVSRPLAGVAPRIDLAIGYRKDNPSPMLAILLASADQFAEAGPIGKRRP